MIFVMAVLLVSRLTDGFVYGIIASFIGVFAVNYIFTYPFLEFNFTITGYPLTFFTMLVVSLLTSAMTTQIKLQEHLRAESEKEKLRADLLRAMSHDIRTPLTSIVGSTSLLLSEDCALSEEKKRELLEDVRDESLWLIRTMENLLSITRIGGDPSKIAKSQEMAEEVIEAAVRKFGKRHPEAPVVRVDLPEKPIFVPMDIILVEQVLENLLENVADHSKNATEIVVSLSRSGDYALFTVDDDGVPISKEVLPHLFRGGINARSGVNADGKRSMGLGLSACMAIVRAHGGSMTASNKAQKGGTEFSFTLPMEETDNED